VSGVHPTQIGGWKKPALTGLPDSYDQKMKRRAANEKEILRRLSAGLSKQEIQHVLAGALSSLDPAGVMRLLQQVGPETGVALRSVLDAGDSKGPPVAGIAKIKEDWDRAWEDWNARIAEACDQEGDYVMQEHHWEQPYCDPLSVTDDLEPIAARMRKLLPRVFDENLDPDLSFAHAVQEHVEEISSSLPNWMDPFANEGFRLGPQATACLIDWEWRSSRRQNMTAFQCIDQLCELEASTKGLGLDEKAVAGFIRGLTMEAKRDILRGIQEKRARSPWKEALGSAHSGWFQVYKELCRGQDRPAYLENCRARIGQDWTLALPVIKDLDRRKDHAEVLKICALALRSFLYLREGETWELQEHLLIERAGYRIEGELDGRLLDLLETWQQAAKALHKEETSLAVRLQLDLAKGWKNWNKALAAFRRVPEPRFSPLRERLFAQWRELVAKKSLGDFLRETDGLTSESNWVHALADAAWKGEDSRDSLWAWLRQWLKTLEKDDETLRRSQGALARLCLDLDSSSWLSPVSPTLGRLLACDRSDDQALRMSRRTWLKRLGVSSLAPELLAFWKRNTHRMVPDPGRIQGADYKHCAEWARALWEIHPASCERLLAQWSVVHQRKRNLWRALRTKGLPIPG
jgi:hypothetical protein